MSSIQVFLTRPMDRNGSVPVRLAERGLDVVELPALALHPLPEPERLPLPDDYELVIFVSRYAVQRYFELLSKRLKGKVVWPRKTIAATVGESSAAALKQCGIVPSECIVHPLIASAGQDSEALLAILIEKGVPIHRALVVRGTQGREWLAEQLTSRGVRVDFLPVYERGPAPWSAAATATLSEALSQPANCVFLLTSSEGVLVLVSRFAELGLLEAWARASFVVIHERIAATLQSSLKSQIGTMAEHIELCVPDDNAIVEVIVAAAKLTKKP